MALVSILATVGFSVATLLVDTPAAGSLADADGDPRAEIDRTPPPPKVLVGSVDVGVFAARQDTQDVVAISPLLNLGVRARREVELGLSMGASTLVADSEEDGQVRVASPSNFVFGTRWVRDEDALARGHHGHVGFAFALPTTFDASERATEAAMYARTLRGAFDPWQWAPSTMGVVLPIGWAFHSGAWEVGADGALAGLFSAGGDPRKPGLATQIRGQAAYRFSWFKVGASLGAVYNGRDPLGRLQTSANPFAELPLCFSGSSRVCGLHARAGASVNLDAPYGFAGDGLRVWGMQFGLRWALRDAV